MARPSSTKGTGTFFTGTDPTDGFVYYRNQVDAANLGLISTTPNGDTFIRTDTGTTLGTTPDGTAQQQVNNYQANGGNQAAATNRGRSSVRIESQKTWQYGLFVADIKNMPGGKCGTWPAFWTLGVGATWPTIGEIDILEGKNDDTTNLVSLHSLFSTNNNVCSIGDNGLDNGALITPNCQNTNYNNPTGCGIRDTKVANNYGLGLNSVGGGYYVMVS